LSIDREINLFDENCHLLLDFIDDLSKLDKDDILPKHHFLAEALMFRMFRNYERFLRSTFLHYCIEKKTFLGLDVVSKLRCDDAETAESILKSGNKFLDWGNVDSVKQLANLVFREGFPVVDMVTPILSTLKDLQRFRNFVAHDSREAAEGYRKSREQYIRVGDTFPESVGELALYRRNARSNITIKIIHEKVSQLGDILQTL
jgi:hypothetical protein